MGSKKGESIDTEAMLDVPQVSRERNRGVV